MTRGRKPKPAHLRLIEGNPGKRRINREEWRPAPDTPVPAPPGYLQETGKAEWYRVAPELLRLGCLHPVADFNLLAAYCQHYERWREAEQLVEASKVQFPISRGLVMQAKTGTIIQNPAVGIANRALHHMVQCMNELGMTPTARARIGAHQDGVQTRTELESLLA